MPETGCRLRALLFLQSKELLGTSIGDCKLRRILIIALPPSPGDFG